jgi:hypothetical protein
MCFAQLLYRRRWARSIMPGFTVTWICEIGWVFALLYDLPWLALVFAFLACIALFAAWYTSVALSAIGLEFADHHDGADSHNYYDDEYDDDNGPGADVVDRGEDFLARADLSNQPDALDVAPASDHDGADAESIGDANSLRRPSSTMSHSSHGTMRTAASALDVHDEPHAHSMNFVNASHALGRRLALERALRRRAWPLARIPLAVHFGVALLRAVINMQIVAVNQFVLIPQSTVYEAIVVTGLSFFTLCVLCISAWQADAIVPTICSLGLFSIAFGPRSCFIPDLCTDNDVVLISQASVTLAGILGVEVLVIVAVFIVRRWRRRHSASADR